MLQLRALEIEDLELLYQVENDRTLWNVATTNVPYSRQILRDFILNTTGDIYTDKQLRLMIDQVAEDGHHTCVGMVDLIDFNPQHRRAEVGITILAEYRKQGYAQEALKQLIAYCKQTLHMHQLYAIVAEDHPECVHLFRTLHFQATGQLRDWLYDGSNYKNALLMQHVIT